VKNKKNPILTKPVLWKDITIVLIIKGILFVLLWTIFFSHPAAEHINTNQAYVDHLLSGAPPPKQH